MKQTATNERVEELVSLIERKEFEIGMIKHEIREYKDELEKEMKAMARLEKQEQEKLWAQYES